MNAQYTKRRPSSEAGVAMLIAIFVLLLIAVVGIALIVSSGTETALAGNYRSSTAVHYAALAGLEEARGRLLPKNPNYFNVFPAPPGTPLPVGQVWYITNPTNGGNVLTDYPDKEFDKEFAGTGVTLAGSTVTTTASVSAVAGIQGPLYRWVRINAVTEASLNLDINNDGNTTDPGVIYYDGAHLTLNATSSQALEITALAVLPNGSQKIAQYIVAPTTLNLNFPAALTLNGTGVIFGPGTAQFQVNGNDQTVGTCAAGPPVTAIGYTGGDASHITATPPGNYIGPTTPSVNPVSLAPVLPGLPGLQDLNALNTLVQTISQNADKTITGPATKNDMPTTMSATNPLTVVVNGDLDLTAWHSTGYGVLLVTGNLNYDPDASWEGIVFVIGKGTITAVNNGSGKFDGAVFLARTMDSLNHPLVPSVPPPALGTPSFTIVSGPGGNGIYYSSCWIKAAQTPLTYKVLSFHEILQQ